MNNVPCENCGKNVFGKKAFYLIYSMVAMVENTGVPVAGIPLKELRHGGFWCSYKCMRQWVDKNPNLTVQ
jgi:hypothetical protein